MMTAQENEDFSQFSFFPGGGNVGRREEGVVKFKLLYVAKRRLLETKYVQGEEIEPYVIDLSITY